jgi:PAS domain S-box-containing protein
MDKKEMDSCLKKEEYLKLMNCEAIFESSPVAMLVIDERTNIVMANLAAVKICGVDENDILKHRPGEAFRCVHSSKDPRGCGYSKDCKTCVVRNALEGLIAKGGSIQNAEAELTVLRVDQPEKLWISVGVEPVKINYADHWCVAIDDITEKKKTHFELVETKEKCQKNEEKLNQIINDLQDAYFQADKDGIFIFANDTAVKMYRFENKEEIIGLKAEKLYADKSEREIMIYKLRQSGKINDMTCRGLRKDGSIFWVSMNVRLMMDNKGNVIGTEGVVRDISERVKFIEELKESKEQLKVLIAQYRKAQDISKSGHWYYYIDNNVFMGSEAALKVYGYESGSKPSLNEISSCITEKHLERVVGSLMRTVEKNIEFNEEFEIMPKNSVQIRWVLSKGIIETDNNGKKIVSGVLQDTTEKKIIEIALNDKIKELSDFINNVVSREVKMTELKEEINELLKELGREPKY